MVAGKEPRGEQATCSLWIAPNHICSVILTTAWGHPGSQTKGLLEPRLGPMRLQTQYEIVEQDSRERWGLIAPGESARLEGPDGRRRGEQGLLSSLRSGFLGCQMPQGEAVPLAHSAGISYLVRSLSPQEALRHRLSGVSGWVATVCTTPASSVNCRIPTPPSTHI